MWTTIFIAVLFLIAIGAFAVGIKSGRQAKRLSRTGNQRDYEDKAETSFWSICVSIVVGVVARV